MPVPNQDTDQHGHDGTATDSTEADDRIQDEDDEDPSPTDASRPPTSTGADGASSAADTEVADPEADRAFTYAQRATASSPMSEGRLRRRMESREFDPETVERALERCRQVGIVDDAAFARALIEEGRRKGYAPTRLRRDLRRREFDAEVIETAMTSIGDRDLESAAYGVAHERAAQLGGVDAETAFRRLVGYLARRGYPEALARKVARQAVFNDREVQRTSER